MITLITGAPGTGKTNALVSLLAELGKDRTVYVHGIPDLKIEHQELTDPSTWPDTVPDGSAVVIDEVQTVWRPRGPGQKVPEHVAKLETHRHRGLDFYIITQGPNLVDSNVRALVGRHIHLRDLGILGRWWYEWPECADNCRTGWKNAPIKKRYRLDKAAQQQYKSASIHVKPVRSIPWMLAVMMVAIITVFTMTWFAYKAINARMNPQQAKPATQAAPMPGGTASAPRSVPASYTPPPAPEQAPPPPAPRLVGCISNKTKCHCFDDTGALVTPPREICEAEATVLRRILPPAPSPQSTPIAQQITAQATAATKPADSEPVLSNGSTGWVDRVKQPATSPADVVAMFPASGTPPH